jgi:cyclopropane fatty-acyl-phospholipid synthase-like methyltransferase
MTWEEYYSVLRQLPSWLKKPVPFVVEALSFFKECGVKAILDLGCGMGRNSIYLAEEGFHVMGIDTSTSALKHTKTWSKMKGLNNMTVLRASMTRLPFVSQTFHAVISVSVIHHATIGDIKKTIEEIHTVLKDNGLFLANLLSTKDYRYRQGEKLEDGTFRILEDFGEKQFEEIHHFFSQREIRTLLAGFKRISLEPIQSGKKEQLHTYWKVTASK